MTPYERITIVKAIDDIESARIAMGAMFGKKGNANEWGECAFFCSLRDILCTAREQLESYMTLHEQQEKRKTDKGGKT